LPKDNGPCDNYTSKWYYDNEARSCVELVLVANFSTIIVPIQALPT